MIEISQLQSPSDAPPRPLRKISNSSFMNSYRKIQTFSNAIENVNVHVRTAFTRNPVIQQNPLLKLLSGPHSTIQDGQNIYKMIKDYPVFKHFFKNIVNQEAMLFKLCSSMLLECYPAGTVIFSEGQESNDKMYVIVDGTVAVVLKSPFQFTQSLPRSLTIKKQQPPLRIQLVQQEIDLQQVIDRYGQKVNELTRGQQFGEKALLVEANKGAQRSATCIAQTDVYLITLHRLDFIEVIKEYKKRMNQKKELLKRNLPKFDTIVSNQIIENLMYSFKEITRFRENRITEEDVTGDYIYILEQGEVALHKKYHNEHIFLTIIDQGIFGEEALSSNYHKYSVVVISEQAKLLRISDTQLKSRSPFCIEGLASLFNEKERVRAQIMEKILARINKINQGEIEEKNENEQNKIEFKQLSSCFLKNCQQNNSKNEIKSQVVKHSMNKLGYGMLSGMEDRNIERIKETTIYQGEPLIQRILDEKDLDEGIEELKEKLIEKNSINNFHVSLKSPRVNNENALFDIEDVSKKIQERNQSNECIDLYPDILKKEMYLTLLSMGVVKLEQKQSKSVSQNNDQIIKNMKENFNLGKQKFKKKLRRYQQIFKNKSYGHQILKTEQSFQAQAPQTATSDYRGASNRKTPSSFAIQPCSTPSGYIQKQFLMLPQHIVIENNNNKPIIQKPKSARNYNSVKKIQYFKRPETRATNQEEKDFIFVLTNTKISQEKQIY